MIQLRKSLRAWNSPDFVNVLKEEVESLNVVELPLQQCLSQSSYATENDFHVIVISTSDDSEFVRTKIGIFYSGLIPGCSCENDPTPVSEYAEYCELQLDIDKTTANTMVTISNLSPS